LKVCHDGIPFVACSQPLLASRLLLAPSSVVTTAADGSPASVRIPAITVFLILLTSLLVLVLKPVVGFPLFGWRPINCWRRVRRSFSLKAKISENKLIFFSL
jgi:hypothetical protein